MFNISHSQNFLTSSALVRALVQRSSITREDFVLDIGAGKGIITQELSFRCKRVEAIEKDPHLCHELKGQFAGCPNVNVHCADFLTHPLPEHPYKIFANIPYTITAAIMRKLLDAANPSTDAYLIMQKEAAQKYAGRPYCRETLISIIHKPWFEFRILHAFKRRDFSPVPAITSVLLDIRKRKRPLVPLEAKICYRDFTTYGFVSNKPSLKKTYSPILGYERFKRLARDLRFSTNAKPTELLFEQWLGLFTDFVTAVPKLKQQRVRGAWLALTKQQDRITKQHRSSGARKNAHRTQNLPPFRRREFA